MIYFFLIIIIDRSELSSHYGSLFIYLKLIYLFEAYFGFSERRLSPMDRGILMDILKMADIASGLNYSVIF